MELPDDAPKTPKLYFIAGDILLIAAAVLIAFRSGTPLPPAAIYAISGCVLAGALLLVLPFLLDYNRRQERLLTDRQNALEALARTTSSAVEQASIAVSGLNEVADLAQKNLKLADQLPHKLHERINEFKALHDEAMAAELESLQQEVNTLRASEGEKLETAADKVQRAAAEFAKLDQVVQKHVAALDDAAKRAGQSIASASSKAVQDFETGVTRVLEDADARLKVVRENPAPKPVPATVPVSAPAAAPAPAPTPVPAAAPPPKPLATPPPPPPPKASPPPAAPAAVIEPRVVTPAQLAPAAAPAPASAATAEAPGPDETAQFAPDEEQSEPALSSDGRTRLIVTAYIGIGNKLFIRGDAPGLSWDKGVPLQFVSIGKWRWETADATRSVSLKLYKNDQVECAALGTIRLDPGHQRELSANF